MNASLIFILIWKFICAVTESWKLLGYNSLLNKKYHVNPFERKRSEETQLMMSNTIVCYKYCLFEADTSVSSLNFLSVETIYI